MKPIDSAPEPAPESAPEPAPAPAKKVKTMEEELGL